MSIGRGRRVVSGVVAVLLLGALVLPVPSSDAHVCQPDPEVGAGGALLVPSGGGLAMIGLADRAVRAVPVLPTGGVVNQVARAADGRLAVARFSRPAAEPIGGSDILVTGPEGGAPLLTIARERPGELLGAPAWLPDGGLVYERGSIVGPAGRTRIERVKPDGSVPRVLVERTATPAVSADGGLLAFVRSKGADRLLVRPLDGGPEHALVENPAFLAIAFPRFSPDGRWIAFSAVAESPGAVPTSAGQIGLRFVWPGVRLAEAHGLPWDVWLIHPDGSGLRRLTFYYDDDPAPAWSPDGRWVAIFGGESIKIVAVEGAGAYCVLGSGGMGVRVVTLSGVLGEGRGCRPLRPAPHPPSLSHGVYLVNS